MHPARGKPGLLAWATLYVSQQPSLASILEKASQQHVPMQALIELTGRCHMDCVHCYLDIKNPPKNELSTAEVLAVFDALKAAGTMFLTLTGGEIFLRSDIFELIAEAKNRHFGVRLFTSGTLLDRDKVARIAALAPTAVEISIYGMRSSVHDAITRRPGSLRKSLRAVILLRQAGVAVAIKSPLLAGAEDVRDELIDAARRLGVGVSVDPSIVTRHDGGTEPLRSRASVKAVANLFADSRLGTPIPTLPGPRSPDESPCAIARRVVKIGATGDVFACGLFPISAGNIRDQNFSELWKESAVLNEIRSFSVGDLQGECGSCSRQGYCGRCSAQALLEHGNFRGPAAESCNRAEAHELARGIAPPIGARHIGDPTPKGRRDLVALTKRESPAHAQPTPKRS